MIMSIGAAIAAGFGVALLAIARTSTHALAAPEVTLVLV